MAGGLNAIEVDLESLGVFQVTLGGKAKNADEKDLATKLVSDVHGVKKVNNNMTVQ